MSEYYHAKMSVEIFGPDKKLVEKLKRQLTRQANTLTSRAIRLSEVKRTNTAFKTNEWGVRLVNVPCSEPKE